VSPQGYNNFITGSQWGFLSTWGIETEGMLISVAYLLELSERDSSFNKLIFTTEEKTNENNDSKETGHPVD
jgi:hypothetical protein